LTRRYCIAAAAFAEEKTAQIVPKTAA